MKGEKGSTESRSSFACSSSAERFAHAYATGSAGRYRSTFPFQIPTSSVLLAPVKGDPATHHHPFQFPGKEPGCLGTRELICKPGDLGPTGNSPKPFSLHAAPIQVNYKSQVRMPDPV